MSAMSHGNGWFILGVIASLAATSVPPALADDADACDPPHLSVRIERLAKWLKDLTGEDSISTMEAIVNLQLLGSDDGWAVPQLREACSAEAPHVRFNAVAALRLMGPAARPAEPELTRAVHDSYAPAMSSAVVALYESGVWPRDKALEVLRVIRNAGLFEHEGVYVAEAQLAIQPSIAAIEALIKATRSDEESTVAAAHNALARHRHRCVAELTKLLEQSDDQSDIEEILTQLGHCGSVAATAARTIASLPEASRAEIRAACMDTLGRIDAAPDVVRQPLLECLGDDVAEVRWNAAKSLSRLQLAGPELLTFLKEQLDVPDVTAQKAALICILQLEKAALPLLDDVRRLATTPNDDDGARHVLSDVYDSHGLPVYELFGKASIEQCISDFQETLSSGRDPEKLRSAMQGLIDLKEQVPQVGPELVKLLSHEDVGLAQFAAYGLVEISVPFGEDLREGLIAALDSDDPTTRDFVIDAIAKRTGVADWAVPALIDCWQRCKNAKPYPPSIPAALAEIGDPRGISVIREGLRHSRFRTRGYTAYKLSDSSLDVGLFRDELVTLARTDASAITRIQATRALHSLDPHDPLVDSTICDVFQVIQLDPEFGFSSIHSLMYIAGSFGASARTALPTLTAALRTSALSEFHKDAVAAILLIDATAAEEALPVLDRMLRSEDENLRGLLDTLGKMGAGARSLKNAVILQMESDYPGVRRNAVEALLNICNESAIGRENG